MTIQEYNSLLENIDNILDEMKNIDNFFVEKYNISLSESEEILTEFLGFSNKRILADDGKTYRKEGLFSHGIERAREFFTGGRHKSNISGEDLIAQGYAREARKNKKRPDGTKKTKAELEADVAAEVKTKLASPDANNKRARLQTYERVARDLQRKKRDLHDAGVERRSQKRVYNTERKALAKAHGSNSSEAITGIQSAARGYANSQRRYEGARSNYTRANVAHKNARTAAADILG